MIVIVAENRRDMPTFKLLLRVLEAGVPEVCVTFEDLSPALTFTADALPKVRQKLIFTM